VGLRGIGECSNADNPILVGGFAMWANRIVDAFLAILSLIFVPVGCVTTFVLGILVTVSFGLLLLPFSLFWVVLFMGPLLGLSWLWSKVPFLRIPVGCCGIPIAVIGYIYCVLLPSMGELDSRFSKLALCETFPFTLDCWAFVSGKRLFSFERPDDFGRVVLGFYRRNPTIYKYLTELPLRNRGAKEE
jgi:hypothetical protein